MYNWKACLFSTWAGQSLSKYVLSRRAATNSSAAYVVSMEAFSSAFSFTFHWIPQVSVVTNSLMLGLGSQKSTLVLRRLEKTSAKKKRKKTAAHELNSTVKDILSKFWSILLTLKLQNTGFTHLKVCCILKRSEPSFGISSYMFTIIFLGEKNFKPPLNNSV